MTDIKKARELLHEFKGDSYLFGPDVLSEVGQRVAAAGKKAASFAAHLPAAMIM